MADPDSLVGAYFHAWNAHDGAALAGRMADDHRACWRCGTELQERPTFW